MEVEQPQSPYQPNKPEKSKGESFVIELLKRAARVVVTWNVVMACLFGTLLVFGLFGALLFSGSGESESSMSYEYIYGKGRNEFLSIPITGVIVGSNNGDSLSGLFSDSSQTYGYDIKQQLYDAVDDPAIQGVILEIDSPGGTIYGAHAIADGVKYYREQTKKPVFAHVEGSGASGAYWAAVSTDKIYADYGSDTGSIGVIMGPFEYYDKVTEINGGLLGGGVVTQNGIESVTLTAGKSKDIGNPYRKLTDAEIASLQQTVNNEYDGFVQYVSQRRNIPDATIRDQIGAMVYDSKTAKELKLVDEVGSRQDAYDALAKAAKVEKGDYTIIRQYTDPGFVGSLLGAIKRGGQPKAQETVDLCKLTRSSLAYHGDVTSWCSKDD